MKKTHIEVLVGLFMTVGIVCMAYTSIKLGNVSFFKNDYYPLQASFTSVAGLKEDTNVEISGVKVGYVESIRLDNYQAVVTMLIKNGVEVSEDAIASILTKGILGDQYIQISPGASDVILEPGGMVFDTEPPFDLLSMIKNFVVDTE